MIFTELPLSGAYGIVPEKRGDARGFFARIFCEEEFGNLGLNTGWAQMNISHSAEAGTLRGLHFQRPPMAEVKLIRCMAGRVLDVILDLRHGSPTFGQHTSVTLDAATHNAIYVPEGFAHGFQTLVPGCELQYFHSVPHAPDHEGGVTPLDPRLGIDWPLPVARMSERDRALPKLTEVSPL